MRDRSPTTRTMKISEVKSTFSSLVNGVYRKETRVLVEKSGIPVAALVSAEDLELLTRLDEQRARRREVVDAMREPFRGVPADDIERATDRIIAEIEAEERIQAFGAQ